MDADPLEIMRKAARLQEAIAAREQKKGDKANLQRMADAMAAAASIANQIAAIEDRRGIRSGPVIDKIEVELVETASGNAKIREENEALKVENETLRAAMARPVEEVSPEIRSNGGQPPGAPLALPDPNGAPLRETADERRARIIAENRRAAGDVLPFVPSLPRDRGEYGWVGRFDFPTRGW